MPTYRQPDLFDTPCANAATVCASSSCPYAVVRHATSADWFITFGHPGFNSPANNGFGYRSERAARAAIHRSTRRK